MHTQPAVVAIEGTTGTMKKTLQTILYSLCAGLVVVYYSESMFWSGLERKLDGIEFGITALVYSIVFYLVLLIADRFQVQTPAGWFLLGAVYGWLVEGVIVQTTYEALPLTISWTALGWHAPISVLVGWYGMRWWMRRGWWPTLLACIGLGIFQGIWSLGWWQEQFNDPNAVTGAPIDVLLSNLILGVTLVVGYWGADRLHAAAPRFGRMGLGLVTGFLALWFVIVTVPLYPIALGVLPPCLLLALLPLWRKRTHGAMETPAPTEVPAIRYLMVLLIPLIASGLYALLNNQQFELQALFGMILIPLGFIGLVLSLWRVSRLRTEGI